MNLRVSIFSKNFQFDSPPTIRHKRVPFLVAILFCTYGYLLELIFSLLIFRNKGVRVLAGPF